MSYPASFPRKCFCIPLLLLLMLVRLLAIFMQLHFPSLKSTANGHGPQNTWFPQDGTHWKHRFLKGFLIWGLCFRWSKMGYFIFSPKCPSSSHRRKLHSWIFCPLALGCPPLSKPSLPMNLCLPHPPELTHSPSPSCRTVQASVPLSEFTVAFVPRALFF